MVNCLPVLYRTIFTMELSHIIPHIEALIFASDKPLTSIDLTTFLNDALGFIDDQCSITQVETCVEGICEKYDTEFYAFELKQIGGGWQFLTKPQFHNTVALLNGDKFIKKLSTAALETLAIIAYKQPITKSEMEAIRGVNCDYAVQKLLEKDLVIISGRNEEAVGKPLIYGTSKSFMDYFGINSAHELPKISEVLMEQLQLATLVSDIAIPDEETAAEDQQIVDDVIEAATTAAESEEDDLVDIAQTEVDTESNDKIFLDEEEKEESE